MFKKYHFSYPKQQELIKQTIITIVTVLVSAGFVQLIDMVSGYIQKTII